MPARHRALPFLVLPCASCGDGDPNGPCARVVHETTPRLLAPPVNPDGINRVPFRWTTSATKEAILVDHLESLVDELDAGNARVDADAVRLGGACRPVGSATRAGLTWSCALGPDILREVNNVLIDQQNQSSGTQDIVSDGVTLQTGNNVIPRPTARGILTCLAVETLASQSTVAAP